MVKVNHFYDQQIRRAVMFVGRFFSNFQVEVNNTLRLVPCRYAESSRQIAQILSNGSENTLIPTPFITYMIENIEYDNARRGNRSDYQDLMVSERYYNESTKNYTGEQGNQYHVKRLNPILIDLSWKVFILCSTTDQKSQLMEQILMMFQQPVTIQISNSPLDPASSFDLELTGINWASRSFPVAVGESLYTMDLSFKCTMGLNPPAIVKPLIRIEQINQNLELSHAIGTDMFDWDSINNQMIISTPGDHYITIDEDTQTVLLSDGNEQGKESWYDLFNLYGKFEAGQTQIKLRYVEDIDNTSQDMVLTVTSIDANPKIIHYTIDNGSLPAKTLPDVDGIIDPHEVFPGEGLPGSLSGQRYLLTNDIGTSVAWGSLNASENDIIEYNGSNWIVSFDASETTTDQVVENSASGKRLFLHSVEKSWVPLLEGEWYPGRWRIVINGVS